MEEQALEPYLIALLYEFFDLSLSNKKGSELELGPRQHKILSKGPPKSAVLLIVFLPKMSINDLSLRYY